MDKRSGVALVTGAASGIGAATMALLEARGWRVIGVDLRDAEIIADLSSAQGRAAMINAVTELAPDGLDLVVAAAGISFPVGGLVLAVNYFGMVATLEGLRPLLALRAPAQAIALVSVSAIDDVEPDLLEGCFVGDETATLARAAELQSTAEYATSKRALGLWLRRSAVRPEWAGAGVFLNGIAPGFTLTDMTKPLLADPELRMIIEKATPRAVDHFAEADVQAEAILALADLAGRYLVGQILFVDGGSEAIRRPDVV